MKISDGIHVPVVASQVMVFLLAPCSSVLPPQQAKYFEFTGLDYNRIQEVCEAGGTLNQANE